jgi:hypothetical protein
MSLPRGKRLFRLGLVVTGLVVALGGGSAQAAMAIPGVGCEGDPPVPASPYVSGVAVKPKVINTGDPFNDKGVSIESVYGTTPQWWNYDNGCSPTAGFMPNLGAELGNLGLQTTSTVPNWAHILINAVIAPSDWLAPLNKVVTEVTGDVSNAVWLPWLAVVLAVVTVLVLNRVRTGSIDAAITTVAWALLVLVGVSWTLNYPAESVNLVDQASRTAVVNIADGFNGNEPAIRQAGGEAAALEAVDQQMDQIVRSTQYRAWVTGVFGDPDSATAREYGGRVFEATHFSWAEYDKYVKDPKGDGKEIRESKQDDFTKIAEEIKDADPVAYESFTGNNWGQRLGVALLNGVIVVSIGWFLLAAGLCMLVGFVLIRLLVPISPALGIVYMIEPAREHALNLLKRAFGPIVMAPIYFLATLVLLGFDSVVLPAPVPFPLKLAIIVLASFFLWKLLRPYSNLPKVRIPGLRTLTTYLSTKRGAERGTRGGSDAATEENEDVENEDVSASRRRSRSQRVVYHDDSPSPRPALPAGSTASPRRLAAAPATFIPAEDRDIGEQSHSARRARAGSAHLRTETATSTDKHPTPSTHMGTVYVYDDTTPELAPRHPAGDVQPADGGVVYDEAKVTAQVVDDAAIHEANLTYDSDGNEVFVIYTPDAAARDRTLR